MSKKQAIFLFVFILGMLGIGAWVDNEDFKTETANSAAAIVPVAPQERILSDRSGNPVNVVLADGAIMKVYVKNGKLFRLPSP